MRRVAAVAFLVVAAAGTVQAQSSSKAVVAVSATGPSAPVRAGQPFDVSITLAIRSGYHINAQKPSEDYLIGTSVAIQPPGGISVVKTAYPATKYAKFSFSETPLAVYQGTVQIVVTLKSAATDSGSIVVPGKVTFQSCNDEQCLPPSTVDFTAQVEIEAAASDADQAVQTITIGGVPSGATVFLDTRPAGQVSAQGRFVLRNVTPGRHKVRVELEGYTPWEQQVVVSAEPLTLAASLTAVGTAPAAAQSQSVQPPAAGGSAAPVSDAAPPDTPASSGSSTFLYVGGGAILGILAALGVYAVTRKR